MTSTDSGAKVDPDKGPRQVEGVRASYCSRMIKLGCRIQENGGMPPTNNHLTTCSTCKQLDKGNATKDGIPKTNTNLVEMDKRDVPTWKFTFQLGDMQGATH